MSLVTGVALARPVEHQYETITVLPALYKLFAYLTYLLTFFLPYVRIGSFHFQDRSRKKRPNLAVVCVFILCCGIFRYGYMFAFVVLHLFLQY